MAGDRAAGPARAAQAWLLVLQQHCNSALAARRSRGTATRHHAALLLQHSAALATIASSEKQLEVIVFLFNAYKLGAGAPTSNLIHPRQRHAPRGAQDPQTSPLRPVSAVLGVFHVDSMSYLACRRSPYPNTSATPTTTLLSPTFTPLKRNQQSICMRVPGIQAARGEDGRSTTSYGACFCLLKPQGLFLSLPHQSHRISNTLTYLQRAARARRRRAPRLCLLCASAYHVTYPDSVRPQVDMHMTFSLAIRWASASVSCFITIRKIWSRSTMF